MSGDERRVGRVLRTLGRAANRVTGKLGLVTVETSYLAELRATVERLSLTVQPQPTAVTPSPASPPDLSGSIVDTRLISRLTDEYRSHPLARLTGLWDDRHAAAIPLTNFRGDSHFVWQRAAGEVNYLVTLLYVRSHDPHKLLDLIGEDGAYGAECLEFEGSLFSRDLLDSANEINFLLDELPLQHMGPLRIVDVGAGYGRLAHRLATVVPEAELFCVDGIAVSTAVCDAYIRCRGLTSRINVVPLTRLESIPTPVLLATNVHSFSEMSFEAVAWWLDWLVDIGVQYLFLVPNFPGPALNDGRSLLGLLTSRGFEVWRTRDKYDDGLMEKYGLFPGVYYLLRR